MNSLGRDNLDTPYTYQSRRKHRSMEQTPHTLYRLCVERSNSCTWCKRLRIANEYNHYIQSIDEVTHIKKKETGLVSTYTDWRRIEAMMQPRKNETLAAAMITRDIA